MAELKQNADGSLGIYSETEGFEVARFGGPKNPLAGGTSSSSGSAPSSGFNARGVTRIKVPLFNSTTNVTGGMGLWISPFNEPILVGPAYLDFVVGQTTTGGISVGTSPLAAGIPALGNNLIDSFAYPGGSATTIATSVDSKGTNGANLRRMAPGDAVVVTSITTAFLTAQINLYFDITKE